MRNIKRLNKRAKEVLKRMTFEEVIRMTETHKFLKTCENFRVSDEWELVTELWSDDEPGRYTWFTEVSVYTNKNKEVLFRVWNRYTGELAEDELTFSGILLTGGRPTKPRTRRRVLEYMERFMNLSFLPLLYPHS